MTTRPAQPWKLAAPALFLLAWGGNHFTPLLPLYQAVMGLEPWQTNALLATYVLGLIPGLLLAASLSNQYGRKPVVITGLVATLVGNTLIGVGINWLGLVYFGRTLAGVGVGVCMSVGVTWMKELSTRAWDATADVNSGARRPSITMTLGFGLGSGVTGVLAQWAPAPTLLPFLLFAGLCVVALYPTARAPETVGPNPPQLKPFGPWYRQLSNASAKRAGFWLYIAPAAPWVFGAGGIAYGLIPQILEPSTGEYTTLYATVLSVVTLVLGAIIQPFGLRLDQHTGGWAYTIGLGIVAAALGLSVLTVITGSALLGLITAVILGIGYGTVLVNGLARVQAFAPPRDLAGLTGIYYSLTYAGFTIPTVLAALLPWISYPASITGLALITGLCLIPVALGRKKLN